MGRGVMGAAVYVVAARHLKTGKWLRTKVGYSTDPQYRVVTIAAHEKKLYEKYELVGAVEHENAWPLEKAAHRFLEEFSQGREWFDCPPAYAWEHVQRIAREMK